MSKGIPLKCIVLLIFVSLESALAQERIEKPSGFLKGYDSSVKGGGFVYHSPQPDIHTSLLLRSQDSSRYIEWMTERVPDHLSGPAVHFVWMFGIDANPDSHIYNLYLNGKYCLSFSNPPVSEINTWKVQGIDGTELTFRTTMLDKYDDPMGYAFFSVPSGMIIKGEKQTIRIRGESAGSNTWYMTFETGICEKSSLTQQDAIIRGPGGKNYYRLELEFVHLGDSVKTLIGQTGGKLTPFMLAPGYNSIKLDYPADSIAPSATVGIRIEGEKPYNLHVIIHPVKHWKLYFVQHAHTDIGYTRPQTEILPEHLRYLDYALDYCDQTDSMPEGSKFKWTCETSWAVNEYLQTRPQSQIERLKRRVKEGRIELTGLFLNSSDLADETTIAASLQPVKFFRGMGFPVKTAMQDDINGVPWCLVDYLSGAGIEYLNMGQNIDRALKPFDRPTTFWWESPSGKRIMVNRPEHYMWGNNLGIINNIRTLEKNLFPHLNDLENKSYPFNEYAIQFSGYYTDNSPPSTKACNIVREWNETYVWPEIRLATISEFLDQVKTSYAGSLPVVRGAWPDWWIDGFGSAPITTAYTRMAHVDFISNNGLMSMALMSGANISPHVAELYHQITQDLAFYDEHTFGAAESISDPQCENSVVQLGEKLSYTWEAVKKNRLLREEVLGSMQNEFPRSKEPSVTVINTLDWNRSAGVNVYIDHQVLPPEKQFRILDPDNREVKIQAYAGREEGTYWTVFADNMPPMGYRSLRIQVSDKPAGGLNMAKFRGVLENQWYRLEIDQSNGEVTGILDKELKRNLADNSLKYKFGQFICERLGTNRAQLSAGRLEEFTRTVWEKIRFSDITTGPVWTSVTRTGQLPGSVGPEGIRCEIRLYNTEKKIEFRYSMKKIPVTNPEGVYISFPFNMKNGKVFYEVSGATVEAGKDQINGSSADWQGIQNFVAIRSDSCQVVFVSPEIPIVQLGDINLGRFSPVAVKPAPVIYSWVLNNYWTTNFLASQEGELKWTYQITSTADISNDFAARFGWSNRVPLLGRVFPGNPEGTNDKPASYAFMNPVPENILLVNSLPSADDHAVTFQLRETRGQKTVFNPSALVKLPGIKGKPAQRISSISQVNVLGDEITKLNGECTLNPFETKFIKLAWNE
jgi:hypothetical protein